MFLRASFTSGEQSPGKELKVIVLEDVDCIAFLSYSTRKNTILYFVSNKIHDSFQFRKKNENLNGDQDNTTAVCLCGRKGGKRKRALGAKRSTEAGKIFFTAVSRPADNFKIRLAACY